jgi:hypothetical protein
MILMPNTFALIRTGIAQHKAVNNHINNLQTLDDPGDFAPDQARPPSGCYISQETERPPTSRRNRRSMVPPPEPGRRTSTGCLAGYSIASDEVGAGQQRAFVPADTTRRPSAISDDHSSLAGLSRQPGRCHLAKAGRRSADPPCYRLYRLGEPIENLTDVIGPQLIALRPGARSDGRRSCPAGC